VSLLHLSKGTEVLLEGDSIPSIERSFAEGLKNTKAPTRYGRAGDYRVLDDRVAGGVSFTRTVYADPVPVGSLKSLATRPSNTMPRAERQDRRPGCVTDAMKPSASNAALVSPGSCSSRA
jgi:hypothetical protein